MNKKIILIFLLITSCSLDNKTGLWSNDKKVDVVDKTKVVKLNKEKNILDNEFNKDLKITLSKKIAKNKNQELQNNNSQYNYDGDIKKSSKFKFKKINNFYQNEPDVIFDKGNIFFFDGNGSIIKFEDSSKLTWKKNYYSKAEKKSKPFLFFNKSKNILIVADNIAKYYAVDLISGDLKWSMNNLAPFNSQIKIYEDKFFIVDFSNTLRCFSLVNGEELWNVKTENSLIRSQKKLSIVIIDSFLYFNNSIGDISAIDINKGELAWQLPTQSSLIYEAAFSLKTSDIISDSKSLFFSNNKNQFFSIDVATGSFNWENKVNSSLRPSLVGNYLFTISDEGYLAIIEKNSGNIIRVTDVFEDLKKKKRKKIKPIGFIIGLKNIYLSTNNGRLFVIDIVTGKTVSILKIDNEKISRPIIIDKNLFVIKDNAIIKLD